MEVIASSRSRPVGNKDWNATEIRKLLITREQVEGAQQHKTSCAVLSSQQFLVDLCQSHVQKSRISFPIAQNEVKTQGYAQLGRNIWSVFLMRLLPCCFRGRASLSWEVALVLIAGSPGSCVWLELGPFLQRVEEGTEHQSQFSLSRSWRWTEDQWWDRTKTSPGSAQIPKLCQSGKSLGMKVSKEL